MTGNRLNRQTGFAGGRWPILVGLCLWVLSVPVAAAGSSISISAEQWARVSSASDFMAIPGLKSLVDPVVGDKDASRQVLEIHYAGGESGQLWAQQVRNRLVGLGLESSRIELMQGVSVADQLQISTREAR